LALPDLLLDGKIDKDLLDWLALDGRHSEPPEVNVSGLFRKPSLVARNGSAYQERIRGNIQGACESLKGALADASLIA
jgi:hypothetical protein